MDAPHEKYAWNLREVQAIYTDTIVPTWKDNPLIEALPETLQKEILFEHLQTKFKVVSEEVCHIPDEQRLLWIDQLYEVFQPWDIHIRIAQAVESAIRSGYSKRNPLDADFTVQQRSVAASVHAKDPNFSAMTGNAKAVGFSVIGYSGMGKTSSIQRALGQYPQIIYHTEYKGRPFPFNQIVWMKLNCPHDSSIKGLCAEFFQEFDRLMNDNTYQRFAMSPRATTDLMLPQMALLASRHGLGALIIDEIQNLSGQKSRGAETMLRFFTQLVNKIGVPIILVGTQAAMEVLTADVATARRFSGPNGAVIMDLLKKESDGWEMLLRGLKPHQWTNKKADLLSPEIQEVLYRESGGMVAHVVNLIVQAQKYAIEVGVDQIDADMISRVAQSDDNIMIRTRLDDLKQFTLSKVADRDFTLQLQRVRANANRANREEPQRKQEKVGAKADERPKVEMTGKKKRKSTKAELSELEKDIVTEDMPY